MNPTVEEIVLVDEQNTVLGTLPKSEVHTSHTPLHRGFSVFLFDQAGNVLLQQRSAYKQTWPLIWSGSCCGHPMLDESLEHAIRRRTLFELGISEITSLQEILPHFRYQCVRNGIMENEICPVWVGTISSALSPNPQEVAATLWKSWEDFSRTISQHPGTYSEWCELEVAALNKELPFNEYRKTLNSTQN